MNMNIVDSNFFLSYQTYTPNAQKKYETDKNKRKTNFESVLWYIAEAA